MYGPLGIVLNSFARNSIREGWSRWIIVYVHGNLGLDKCSGEEILVIHDI